MNMPFFFPPPCMCPVQSAISSMTGSTLGKPASTLTRGMCSTVAPSDIMDHPNFLLTSTISSSFFFSCRI
jgi:hypothetical protein